KRQQVPRRRSARHRPLDTLPEAVPIRSGGVSDAVRGPRARTPLERDAVTLSVLVPIYNERDTIDLIVDQVNAAQCRKEIICVDDASTDGTREVLETLL